MDLTQLRQPEQAKALVDIVLHADLDSATLQAIRAAAAARLPESDEVGDLPTLRAKQRAELYVVMKERVFGDASPSVARLRKFLKDFTARERTTYEEKKEVCKTVNFWKAELDLDLLYDGQVCRLSPKSPCGDRGGFILRVRGRAGTIYSATAFPLLTVRARH